MVNSNCGKYASFKEDLRWIDPNSCQESDATEIRYLA